MADAMLLDVRRFPLPRSQVDLALDVCIELATAGAPVSQCSTRLLG